MRIHFALLALVPFLVQNGTSQERLIPYDEVFINVHTKPLIDRKHKGEKLNVSVRMSKGNEDGNDSASIDVNCNGFSHLQRMMPENDLETFFEIGEAALAGKDARKEVVTKTFGGELTSAYESVRAKEGRVIRITRGAESVDFPTEEAGRVRAALEEARIGQAWYEKILVATELPKATPDARPPRSGGYYLDSQVGLVSGRGISYEITVSANAMLGDQSYGISHGLIFYENGHMAGTMSGDWIKALLHKVTLALDAAKNGSNYSFKSGKDDGRSYEVKANLGTKEADLILTLGNFFGKRRPKEAHFGVAQLEEIRGLIDEYEVRKQWFANNEDLFFSPSKEE